MKELKKQHLEMLQLLESIEVMLQNGDSIHPNSVIRGAIQTAIGMDINLNNMTQTAVEWLVEHLTEYGFDLSHHKIEIEQAKVMEKRQELKMPDYNLDELAKTEYPIGEVLSDEQALIRKLAFQKALELLTFKSE